MYPYGLPLVSLIPSVFLYQDVTLVCNSTHSTYLKGVKVIYIWVFGYKLPDVIICTID